MSDDQENELLIQLLNSLNIELTPQRNEPCYCGSGKKYKKCCQEKDQTLQKDMIHLEFEITDDPSVLLDLGQPLSKEDKDQLMACLDILSDETSPKDSIVLPLRALAHKYQNPFIWEKLRVTYEFLGNTDEAQEIQTEIESQFPDDFLSRFERAARALEEKRFEAFEECFNGCSSLTQLYPRRTVFHFSEVILFHLQWLTYCAAVSDLRKAQGHFQILEEILDEDDPALLQAQKLMEILYLQRKALILAQRME